VLVPVPLHCATTSEKSAGTIGTPSDWHILNSTPETLEIGSGRPPILANPNPPEVLQGNPYDLGVTSGSRHVVVVGRAQRPAGQGLNVSKTRGNYTGKCAHFNENWGEIS
jgi:hypothetical protein